MLAAAIFATICLQHVDDSACVADEVIANVGSQLLSRVVPDANEQEQAAFLTRDAGGDVQCRLWPLTQERSASTFHGTVPSGAIAIIHTHPHDWFAPSQQDGALSTRLGLPVLVITRRYVSIVDPDGQWKRWSRAMDRHVRTPLCEPMGP